MHQLASLEVPTSPCLFVGQTSFPSLLGVRQNSVGNEGLVCTLERDGQQHGARLQWRLSPPDLTRPRAAVQRTPSAVGQELQQPRLPRHREGGKSSVEGWGPWHGLPGWCALGGAPPPVAWRVLSSSVAACGVVLGLLQPSSVLSAPEQCLGHSWTVRNAPLCLGCLIHCCAGNVCMQFLAHAWAWVPGLWAPPPGAFSRPAPLIPAGPLGLQGAWGVHGCVTCSFLARVSVKYP